jgi:DNA-directed RNA polymerase subunit RPC12/RpoP
MPSAARKKQEYFKQSLLKQYYRTGEVYMEVVQYKCPNCSANLEFRTAEQDFGCKFCDSAFSSEMLAEIYPKKEEHALDMTEPPKTAEEIALEEQFGVCSALYNCPSCGASVVTDDNTSATKCVYCLSPVILTGRLSGEYKPSKLIPFKVEKTQAEGKFKEYCKKRWFLPKNFRDGSHLHDMMAIYVPYWISDCTTAGAITANCKKIRTWISGGYKYTETKEYIAVRDGSMDFEGIPHNASTRTDDVLMECIEPFGYTDTTDFKMSFLSGFIAEKYDVTKEQVFPRVKDRAVSAATAVMRQTITGYNSVNVVTNTVDISKNKWQHFLLPVWLLSYKFNEKFYHFAINGQTGKFAGDLPIDKKKLTFAAVGAAAGVAGAIAAILLFGGLI